MQHFTCFIYLASTSAVNLNSPINLVCLCVCVCAHKNVCVAFRSHQATAICTRKLTIFSFHLFSLHYSILLWLPHKELLDLIKCQCALCWTENRNPVFPLEDTEWNVSLLLPQRWIYCNYHFSKPASHSLAICFCLSKLLLPGVTLEIFWLTLVFTKTCAYIKPDYNHHGNAPMLFKGELLMTSLCIWVAPDSLGTNLYSDMIVFYTHSSLFIYFPVSSSLFHLSQGIVTFSCSEPVFVAMTFTGPQSFLRLPRIDQSSLGISVGLQFRTWNKAGLLLTFELPNREGRVWLYLSKARAHLQIHKSGRAPLELNAGQSDNSKSC